MIEASIFNWVNVNDSMQLIDAYTRHGLTLFFRFFYLLRKGYECNTRFGVVVLVMISFGQFISLAVINGRDNGDDGMVMFMIGVSKVFLLQEMIISKGFYVIIMIALCLVFIIVICIVIYLIIRIGVIERRRQDMMMIGHSHNEDQCNWLIILLTIINKILITVLIGPLINISLLSILCDSNGHIYLNVPCYTNWQHLTFFIISIFFILFFTTYTLLLSIYSTRIAIIEDTNPHKQITIQLNCNYNTYLFIAKILSFIAMFLMKHFAFFNTSRVLVICYHILLFLISLSFIIYIERNVLFYDCSIQFIHILAWLIIGWFDLVMLLKVSFGINDSIMVTLCGWVIVGILAILYEKKTMEDGLLYCNVMEVKRLKTLEFYVRNLLRNRMNYEKRGKLLLKGIVAKFENSLMLSVEKMERYKRMNDSHNGYLISVLNMVLLIYEHHLDKSLIKNEVLFVMCYFLVKYMKNWVYALSLCSKMKVSSHKHLYIKYCLTEEIKEMLTRKMVKGLNHSKDAIKHIDTSSVILYNRYIDMFKIKIYDAVCNQMDYFELVKNNSTTPRTTQTFIKTGEDIIVIRKDITKLWYKIIELNPFSEENERDYLLYLDIILQDTEHSMAEIMRYETNQLNFINERNSLYHSLFNKDTTAIVLIDGYSMNNKVIYSTLSFPLMFGYTMKEVVNMTIEDFVPNPISGFHKEISYEAVKQSTFRQSFNNQKDLFIKGKSGGVFSINAYIKPLPNVSYGLVYIGMIQKVQEQNYTIVLDKDFKICALSDVLSQGIHYTVNSNYGLNNRVFGTHIGVFLPEILLQMTYDNQRFNLCKGEIDLKGNLYSIDNNFRSLSEKVDIVLEKIKHCSKFKKEDKDSTILQEYNDLIVDIQERISKSFSIFYKIKTRVFLDGKYTYHHISLTNDLIILNSNRRDMNDNDMSFNSIGKCKRRYQGVNSSEVPLREKNLIKLNIYMDPTENKRLLEKDNKASPTKYHNRKLIIPQSSSSQSSLSSTPLNQFKHHIATKQPNTLTRILLFLTCLSSIISIILLNIDGISLTDSFSHIKDYLQQNKFFNASLISTACIYLNSINLKLLKYAYLRNDACSFIECSEFYQMRLTLNINELKNLKTNISEYYDDYKQIINQTINITTNVRRIGVVQYIMIDGNNLLNMLLSNGYRVIGNANKYIEETKADIEINVENVIKDTFYYLNNRIIVGLNETMLKENIGRIKSGYGLFIVQMVIWGVIGGVIGIIITRIYMIEGRFMKCVVYYHSGKFDVYLKQLDELKNKLGQDGGVNDNENEDLIEGEGEVEDKMKKERNNESNENSSKKDNDINGSIKGNLSKKQSRKKVTMGKEGNKNNTSHHRSKLNKIQMQKNEKIAIMSKYFLHTNISFSFKLLIILLIGTSYFIIATLLNNSHYDLALKSDITMNSIQGVFNQIYYLFVMIKYLLLNYTDYETEKKRGIAALEGGAPSYIINNITFTSIEDIQKSFLKLIIPEKEDIIIPQIGNLFMQLMQYSESNSNGVEKLKVLFNGNSCSIMMNKNSPEYPFCEYIWSGILMKGLEQSIVQIGVVIGSIIEDLNMLNNQEMGLDEIFFETSKFSELDHFANFFLHSGLIKVNIFFLEIKEESLAAIKNLFQWIRIAFALFYVIQLFLFIYVIYSYKKDLDSLLNFVVIVPIDFILEDDSMHEELLEIHKSLYLCSFNKAENKQ